METPKKPLKKTSVTKKSTAKKTNEKATAAKPKSRFLDDDDDDEFDAPIDDLGAYDHLDGLEEEDDY